MRVDDFTGQPLTNDFASQDVKGSYFGFPGFSVTATQTLAYVADMQEHGIPVTYGYISDEHGNFGSGDPRYEAQLKADDQAFGQAFYGVHRRHLEPPWPRVEELTACGGQLASSPRVRTAAPRKCRENLHSGERPHHHTRIFA